MNRDEIISEYLARIDRNDRQKLSTEERAFLVQDFIEQLQSLESAEAIELLCRNEIEMLERGYGSGTNSTTNYLSDYRKAIAQATEQGKLPMTDETSYFFSGRKRSGEAIRSLQHLAYDLMRYDNEIYAANRKATNVGNNERQDNPQPFNPDRYLEKATELLQSNEPETLAVGIAAVTGRRHTEVVVSGSFSLTKHSYVLLFGGQLKKADPVEYAILTLIPAAQVKEAIDRFRATPQVQALAGRSSTDRELAAFRARVNTRVKRHFQETEILPLLPGFQSVSIHRLRAAYARLAIHYWIPSDGVNQQRWLQFYLGHVSPGEMRDAANSTSTAHYFGYRLVDATGKPITVTGIKLMAHPLPSPTQQQLDTQQSANNRLNTDTTEPDPTPQEEEPMPPTPQEIETVAADLETLPSKDNEQVSTIEPPPGLSPDADAQPSKTKRSKPRYRELRVNLTDLAAAADRLGINASTRSGYQSLLEQVLQAAATESPAPVPAPLDPSELLAPLMEEITALRQQMNAGQQQQEIEQLREQTAQQQQEINRLKAELQSAHDRLAQIVAAAQGLAGLQPTASQPQPLTPQQPVSSQQPAPPAQTKLLGRPIAPGKFNVDDRIALAIAAIMDYNQHQSEHADRWYLSTNAISFAAGSNPSQRTTPWLRLHPAAVEAINQHHASLGLHARHNGKDKDKQQLKQILEQFIEGKSPEQLQHIIYQFERQHEGVI